MTLLQTALDRLLDLEEDPTSALCHALRRAIAAGDTVPTGEIELRATLAPGGACAVHDQHGRAVAGVKTVESFTDGHGNPVLRVCL